MSQKKLIIFMPSIEGGGVEKNLFIISNFISSKIKNGTLITSSKSFNKHFNNLKIINPKINIENHSSRRFKYFLCLLELIKVLLKDRNYLVFSFQANLYCAILCKLLNVNIIIRSNSSPSGWKLNFIRKTIFRFLLKLPDKIIVNSEEFKKEYKKKFGLKCTCIYNPLDKNFIKKKSKENKVHNFFKNFKGLKIIFIGRLVDQKDPFTLLKALNLIKNKINYRSIIIGKGVFKEEMNNYIRKNKLQKNIKIMGWSKNPYFFLNLSNLLVLTSKFEGLPNVLLEAIALKKFVISSNCPTGPGEILDNGKGGMLFKVGDYKDLSKKIIIYQKNKKIFLNKINYAYKRLYRYDHKKNLNNYLKLILNEI